MFYDEDAARAWDELKGRIAKHLMIFEILGWLEETINSIRQR